MKKLNLKIIAFIVICCLGSISIYSQAGRGKGRIKGTVLDIDGNPLKGVEIKMESDQFSKKFETKTDKKGEFAFLGFANGRWKIKTNIKGYLPKLVVKNLSQFGNSDIKITLQKAPENEVTDTNVVKKIVAAKELYNKKKYKEALTQFESILKENKDLIFIKINIANCYKDMGDNDKAVATFHEVITELKEKKEPYVNDLLNRSYIFLGSHYAKIKDYVKAELYFEKATELFQKDENLFYNLGELYMNSNKSEKALKAFKKATEINPNWGAPLGKLGYAYLGLGKIAEAVAIFDKYIKDFPESKDVKDIKAMLPDLRKMVPKK